MWQRFTERARRAVFFAQEEAGRLGENYISTEHILLGLLRDDDSVAVRVLAQLSLGREKIRSEIERQVARGDGRVGQDMQLTPRGKRVIDLAYDEARQLNNNYIGTEHLLLGLLREEGGLARRVLNKLGIELEPTRIAVEKFQAENARTPPDPQPQVQTHPQTIKMGDLGVARSSEGRDAIEVAHDAATFEELVHIFQAKDAHGYRALLQGNQTMLLLPVGTPIKLLTSPANSEMATNPLGMFIRVLAGDFEGYSGWIFATCFERTGSDDSPFPPPIGD